MRFPCSPESSCSSRYCAWFVSWYSSTITYRHAFFPFASASPERPPAALAPLPRRLVRERDREDLVRLHAARGDQMRDAVGEDARLPRARARDDQERALGGENGLLLGLVQIGEVLVRSE